MKIDCNITKNYLRERNKMTKNCTIPCEDCCLNPLNSNDRYACRIFEQEYPTEAIAAVQHWSDEHQQKTMLQDFLEKYPNSKMYFGMPKGICPHDLGYCENNSFCINHTCEECWNRPLHSKV